jgi:hypothetical protein
METLKCHPDLDLYATLAKPFTGQELVAVVDSALQRPRPFGFGDGASSGPDGAGNVGPTPIST